MHVKILRYLIPTVGLALFLAGVLADGRIDHNDLRATGVLVLVVTACELLRRTLTHRALEYTRQGGYDDGYDDARTLTPDAAPSEPVA